MSDHRVSVQLNDRLRLMSAMLSLTSWPEREQAQHPHGVHAHAKDTRRFLEPYAGHAAIQQLQEILNEGRSMEELFAFSQVLSWPSLRARSADTPDWVPSGWTAAIRNFYIASKMANFWKEEHPVWDEAVQQLEVIFQQGDIIGFLTPYLGELDRTLVFSPNMCYPTYRPVTFSSARHVYCICPPRIAWGTNPPWPFNDDPAWVYRTAFEAFAHKLVLDYLDRHPDETADLREGDLSLPDEFVQTHPDWREQFARLFVSGATTIYLEETSGEAEANAYVVMEQKDRGLDVLPAVVSVLRRYLQEQSTGKFNELADFLPLFRNSLRVAYKLNRM